MKTRKLLSFLLMLAMMAALFFPGSATALAEEQSDDDTRAVDVGGNMKLDYGYYLIGRNGWSIDDIGPEDKFVQNYAASATEYKLQTTLEAGQEIKVVLVSNGTQMGPWYPGGDNYTVDEAHAGYKIIYFRPDYNSDWAEFGGHFYIADPPTYHVYFNQPAHGMLIADKTEAMEGETVTVTPIPDAGYYPNFLRSNDYPPNFSNPNAYTATFTMPAYDVTVYMWSNSMSAEPGYYFCSGKNVQELGPLDKFRAEETVYGDYFYETTLTEGNLLSLARIIVETENGFPSNGYSNANPEITADMAGHVRVFLSETEREGYTKAFDALTYVGGTEDMWMTWKYYQPITVLPSDHGSVTAPADAFPGDMVNMTVTHDEGYSLDTLIVTDEAGNETPVDGVGFIMPDSPVTVSATFKEVPRYAVTLVGSGEGVTVTTNKETAQEGDAVDVSITTDANHRFVSITVTDGQGNEIETTKLPTGANKYRFTMPASDVTVTVVSKTIYPLWLADTQADSLNYTDILGDGTASYDPATRTLTFSSAEPDFGEAYSLIYWTGEDGLTIDAPNGLHLTGTGPYCINTDTNSGEVVVNGDLTLNSATGNGVWVRLLTVNGDVSGSVHAFALYGSDGITVNGSVNVVNEDSIRAIFSIGEVSISGDFTAVGYGIDAADGISIGGDVTITGETSTNYGLRSSIGAIGIGGDFSFSGKAVSAASAATGFSCAGSVTVDNRNRDGKGIYVSGGPISVSSETWEIAAYAGALRAAGGIVIPETSSIYIPAGGVLGTLSEDGTDYTAVYEADGKTEAVLVIIKAPEPAGYHIIVTDCTKGKATASIDAEALYSGEVTFTVTCDKACVVAVDNGGDSYTRLTCTTVGEEHQFTVTVADADVTVAIALKGDCNLDGAVRSNDATGAKQAAAGMKTLTGMKLLTIDNNGDGTIRPNEATKVAQVATGVASYTW